MKHGFVKVSAVTPDLRVADTIYNTEQIITGMKACAAKKSKLAVFPELSITGYTCGDLFLQQPLLNGALEGLAKICEASAKMDLLTVVGLPVVVNHKLYNCAAFVKDGSLLGLVPKTCIPNYSEFYEARHFTTGPKVAEFVEIAGMNVPFGTNLLFACMEMPEFVVAAEICEDLWVITPPSASHAKAGATVIVNLSASDEVSGKRAYRRELIKGQSARLVCGYIYSDAGEGESTTDLVFAGHDIIAENGTILAESLTRENGIYTTEFDLDKICSERRRMTTYEQCESMDYVTVNFSTTVEEATLTRHYASTPFVPKNDAERSERCEEIIGIQALGLKKRIKHINAKTAVIGISGGLDSTLALLITVRAFDLLGLPREGVIGVTMPCYGTTDRTYNNALSLMRALKITVKEIPIRDAVTVHLRDIEHDIDNHNVTYENAQARERTQVLMDLANDVNGLVVGTGDLSELALGWATYNGDHMSMYGVNGSIPKTLVRYLVKYFADETNDEILRNTLYDVLDTPVSPELLPAEDGKISQKTEDIVGPYELHDFFLYHMMRFGYMPSKIYRLAKYAFAGEYDDVTILKWLRTFYWRFFSQQFKRSCLPDGPKVGSVALSPRGDWRMPSDACVALWKNDLEACEETC
ncbi:MAG: NAD(+) synthase [Lachnospiraceae bacterium]|nr:NAD(+) synthase [Lachnospiraceae bacterium]